MSYGYYIAGTFKLVKGSAVNCVIAGVFVFYAAGTHRENNRYVELHCQNEKIYRRSKGRIDR